MKCFSKEWYLEEGNHDNHRLVAENYYKYFDELKSHLPEDFDCGFARGELHDASILAVTTLGNNLFMQVFTDFRRYEEITFVNGKIVSQDEKLGGAFWIHCELYMANQQFEIHVLYATPGRREPHEAIILADDVVTYRRRMHENDMSNGRMPIWH